MSSSKAPPLVVHGWTLFAHPLFIKQLEALTKQVEDLKKRDPVGYKEKNASKRLAAIIDLVFEVIPEDPTLKDYRQDDTLGENYTHWFRAKFYQQYRLFFRYHSKSKIIVFAWVNDEKTKRAYGKKTDAYKIFSKMLKNGNPPDDWDQLLASASADAKEQRLRRLANKIAP